MGCALIGTLAASVLAPHFFALYENHSIRARLAQTLAAIKPSTVHVVVQNGSGISGLATAVSAKLTKLGYVVDSVGNADTFEYETTQIRPLSKVPYVGERVRSDLGVAGAAVAPATDSTPGPRTVVTVIVGRDYAIARATAAPTSSAAPTH